MRCFGSPTWGTCTTSREIFTLSLQVRPENICNNTDLIHGLYFYLFIYIIYFIENKITFNTFLKSSSCRVSNLISKRVTFFPFGALSLVLVLRDKTIFHKNFFPKREKNQVIPALNKGNLCWSLVQLRRATNVHWRNRGSLAGFSME